MCMAQLYNHNTWVKLKRSHEQNKAMCMTQFLQS